MDRRAIFKENVAERRRVAIEWFGRRAKPVEANPVEVAECRRRCGGGKHGSWERGGRWSLVRMHGGVELPGLSWDGAFA